MKKVGIIFPMKEELDAIREYLTIKKEKTIYELNFIEGTINNVECVLVESGVGKVNAARTTQILIDNYKRRQSYVPCNRSRFHRQPNFRHRHHSPDRRRLYRDCG